MGVLPLALIESLGGHSRTTGPDTALELVLCPPRPTCAGAATQLFDLEVCEGARGGTAISPAKRARRPSARDALAAAVDRDRELVEQNLVLGIRHVSFETLDQLRRPRRCGEQACHDLVGRMELHELLLERLGEPAAAEIPAVELLQKARGALLAELAHTLADEVDQLRGYLLSAR